MVELERTFCTWCGGEIENVDPNVETVTCPRVGCGATFLVNRAKESAGLQAQRAEELANLRKQLDQAEQDDDQVLMERWAQEIIVILPDDAFAAYCIALGKKKRGKYPDYASHLAQASAMTEWEAERILSVALHDQHYSPHDDDALKAFIQAHFSGEKTSQMMGRLTLAINRRFALVNRWNVIPRGVFICHSSKNTIALEVYDALIDDGVSCWISERNLRPGTRNYWDEIDLAIQKCDIILVVSSRDSMLSDDPVREMEMAENYGLARLQLKIDDNEQTTYFKHYFDGLQWVKLGEDKEATLREIKARVFELLKDKPPTPEVQPSPIPIGVQPSFLFIHYMDNESGEQFQLERRELQPGKYIATPNPDYTPKGALFGENSEIEVEIGPRGGVQKHISFSFSLPIQPVAVPVCYVARETGEELACEERWLDPGERKVIANEGLIPAEYRLDSVRQQPVSVDRYGANPARIAFQCKLRVPAVNVKIPIRYVTEDGKEIASEQRELTPGKQVVSPYSTLLPNTYKLLFASPQEVVVGKDGAKPAALQFVCALKVKPSVVEIRYVDPNGTNIINPVKRTLGPGTHRIVASPPGLPRDYALVSSGTRLVTVGETGAVPDKIVFTYDNEARRLTAWQRFGNILLFLLTVAWIVLWATLLINTGAKVMRSQGFLLSIAWLYFLDSNYGTVLIAGTAIILAVSLLFGSRTVHRWSRIVFWILLILVAAESIFYFTVVGQRFVSSNAQTAEILLTYLKYMDLRLAALALALLFKMIAKRKAQAKQLPTPSQSGL